MDLHVYRNSHDRWHDLRQAARFRGAVLASNAVTLHELVERLTPDRKAASPGQRLVCVTRAVEQAGVGIPGIQRYAVDAIQQLKGAGVRSAELRKTDAGMLADVLDAYNACMAQAGISDAEDLKWLAARRIAEGNPWLRRFDSVTLHAIYDINDAEFEVLRSLIHVLPGGGVVELFNATSNIKPTQFAEWTWQRFIRDEQLADKTVPEFFRSSGPLKDLLERIFVLDPSRIEQPLYPADALRILQCPGRYGEIEAIGEEITSLLDKGADPSEIVVVVRHIDAYGEMIEDVFGRLGVRHSFETGVPLLRIPFIKYCMAFLDLAAGDRGRDALGRVMSSAYYEPRLSPRIDVERTLAEIGYIDRRHLKASALAARRASPLTAELDRLESVLDRLEQTSARPVEFLDQLQPASALTDRDRQAWKILSDEIEAVDPLAGETAFSVFRKTVAEIAGLRTVNRFSHHFSSEGTPPGTPHVRVIPPGALGFREYRWVFAPGFADGEIPAPSGSNPLLPDEIVDDLNTGIRPRRVLNSRDRNRREPLHLFMTLDAAAERLTLTYPSSSLQGEAVYPSIYVGEILRHYDPHPVTLIGRAPNARQLEGFRRKAAGAWRDGLIDEHHAHALLGEDIVDRIQFERRGAARADVGPGVLRMDRVWSPSELDALSRCPFIFLSRHYLKIRVVEPSDFEVPPTEVGNLAHRILREFYSEPIPDEEASARLRMDEIIERQLAAVDIHGQGPHSVIDPVLWRIRRPQLVRALREYVTFAVRDARDGYETLPEYLDSAFPAAWLGTAQLAGRPDHVAVRRSPAGVEGIRIDDFKYSAASSTTKGQLRQSFQIPVYAYLASRTLNAAPGIPIEGRYVLLRSPSTPVVSQAIDDAAFTELQERVAGVLSKAERGRLHPDPSDRQECDGCDYRRLCRLYGG